jgi:RNA polymerase sigma factor (sigma-70 family)
MMGDSDLLRRAVSDGPAFETLYRRHAPRLYRKVARETSADVALDLVAETFARVLISAHRYRGRSDATAVAWLNSVAGHIVCDYLRRERIDGRAQRKLEIDHAVAVIVAESEPLSDEVIKLADAVEEAFSELPASLQEALRLRVVDEHPYDEVARLLEIGPDAARMRVSRGLRALGTRLRGDDRDQG